MGRAWTHKVNVIFGGLFTRPNFFKILPKGKQKGKTKRRKKEGVFSKVVERKKVKVRRGNLKKKKKKRARASVASEPGGSGGPPPALLLAGGIAVRTNLQREKLRFRPLFLLSRLLRSSLLSLLPNSRLPLTVAVEALFNIRGLRTSYFDELGHFALCFLPLLCVAVQRKRAGRPQD